MKGDEGMSDTEAAMLRRIEAVEQELRGLQDYVGDMVNQLHQFTMTQRRRFSAMTQEEYSPPSWRD